MNGKIFISYSWTEPSGSIVNNWLKPCLIDAGISCMIDKDDCGYNGNIDKFERDLPKAAKVVLVLSQPFLFSLDCMFEAALAVSKCDIEKQVYLINLIDYNFRKDSDKWYDKVFFHFKGLKDEYDDSCSKLPSGARGPYKDKIRKVNTIINNLTTLWKMFGSKNSVTFDMASKNKFELVYKELKQSIDDAMLNNKSITDSRLTPKD